MLLAAIGSKLLPVIITDVPAGPEAGVKVLMTGGLVRGVLQVDGDIWFLNNEIDVPFATTKSGLLSPSKSLMAKPAVPRELGKLEV